MLKLNFISGENVRINLRAKCWNYKSVLYTLNEYQKIVIKLKTKSANLGN